MELTCRQLEVIADLISARCNVAKATACEVAHEIGHALEQAGQPAPPRWRWENLPIALRNPAFVLAVAGILVTLGVVLLTRDYIGCAPGQCPRPPILPALLVAGWIVIPPVFFFLELYLRDGGEADRQMLKTYHDYARTIWLALGAVLAAIYGLALKPW